MFIRNEGSFFSIITLHGVCICEHVEIKKNMYIYKSGCSIPFSLLFLQFVITHVKNISKKMFPNELQNTNYYALLGGGSIYTTHLIRYNVMLFDILSFIIGLFDLIKYVVLIDWYTWFCIWDSVLPIANIILEMLHLPERKCGLYFGVWSSFQNLIYGRLF